MRKFSRIAPFILFLLSFCGYADKLKAQGQKKYLYEVFSYYHDSGGNTHPVTFKRFDRYGNPVLEAELDLRDKHKKKHTKPTAAQYEIVKTKDVDTVNLFGYSTRYINPNTYINEYDNRGRLMKVRKYALPADKRSLKKKHPNVQDSLYAVVTYAYDEQGKLIKIDETQFEKKRFRLYGQQGRLLPFEWVVHAQLAETIYSYDSAHLINTTFSYCDSGYVYNKEKDTIIEGEHRVRYVEDTITVPRALPRSEDMLDIRHPENSVKKQTRLLLHKYSIKHVPLFADDTFSIVHNRYRQGRYPWENDMTLTRKEDGGRKVIKAELSIPDTVLAFSSAEAGLNYLYNQSKDSIWIEVHSFDTRGNLLSTTTLTVPRTVLKDHLRHINGRFKYGYIYENRYRPAGKSKRDLRTSGGKDGNK